eukprot:TRINITY_DN26800_c0_g1_i1.p1 TRINITY_DN26800_c0_g1~~TRINITY_DN26800_c0_g1_i1.p1  ORF type:complete len:757 (+),score=186.25 TRINITY_DN26800_c0_g1_i1:47-2272(+)
MRVLPLVACLVCATTIEGSPLVPRNTPLPVGSVTPKGWLLKQLTLQAEGLSGHLSQFWPDVMSSIWIGGQNDSGLHERTPYWLNGVVPLSFLLKNAGVDLLPGAKGIYKAPVSMTPCKQGRGIRSTTHLNTLSTQAEEECWKACINTKDCKAYTTEKDHTLCSLYAGGNGIPQEGLCYNSLGVAPVNMTAQVEEYVTYILSHQNPTTGWLGPDDLPTDGDQYWGAMNVLQALYQYAEGMDDGSKSTPTFLKVSDAIYRHLMEAQKRLAAYPMDSWSAARWIDMALSAEWLLDNAPQGHETELMALLTTLHAQGDNWEQWFETWRGRAGSHNVNNAQGLKSAAVWYRFNPNGTWGNYSLPELSVRRMNNMDATYGLPTGMFNGDELLPNPPTRNPSRGIETCGVVESMFSYTIMYSVHDNIVFADRTERIAFNALPATWASPTGGDMWAHQYLQAVNEINAIKAVDHVWQHDGAFSETYGLEPNYGCCTANFNQGWPKFASNLFYVSPEGALVVGLYSPASGKFPGGHVIDVDTAYPFDEVITVTVKPVSAVTLKLRIPSWAKQAAVNGTFAAGPYFTAQVTQEETFVLKLNPEVRVEQWDNGTVSIHHGALMYSLPIQPNYTVYAHHWGSDTQSNDYYLDPTSKWEYALDVNMTNPQQSLSFKKTGGYVAGSAPFNHSNWPTAITATLRPIEWGILSNSATSPPVSPVCKQPSDCGQPVQVDLVPHGGTELRIGEFPRTGL